LGRGGADLLRLVRDGFGGSGQGRGDPIAVAHRVFLVRSVTGGAPAGATQREGRGVYATGARRSRSRVSGRASRGPGRPRPDPPRPSQGREQGGSELAVSLHQNLP